MSSDPQVSTAGRPRDERNRGGLAERRRRRFLVLLAPHRACVTVAVLFGFLQPPSQLANTEAFSTATIGPATRYGMAPRAGALPALAQGSRNEQYGILSLEPASTRSVPIETLRGKAATLARAFVPHVHRSATGEQMPYRLFTPPAREKGRKYPLVVFLHGAGGSGTDNARQLQGANVFGALVWTLPENQRRHPAFVVAPPSDWNCAISRVMIEALRKAGGRPRYTEYPGIGHDAFMWAYTEPALVEWLFAHKR